MTQQQIDDRMQVLMQAEAEGKITPAEFEAHLDAIREVLREEDQTERALRWIAEALNA